MHRYFSLIMFIALTLATITLRAQQGSDEKQVIQSMNEAADKWNNGDLDGYMALYDTSATMMLPKGRTKINGMRELYEKYYFENGKPKQMLGYDTYEFTPLGKEYALLTGRFILKANEKMKERTGTFSLVFVHTANGWKILHDHSG
ncbi:YybH family protein [Flavisolibacter ginsengisoli]|nr:nuclear transport factor 2 family protein [Flavisolibacter ginsengisoli]